MQLSRRIVQVYQQREQSQNWVAWAKQNEADAALLLDAQKCADELGYDTGAVE